MTPRPYSPDLAALARASDRKRDASLLRATTELYVLDTTHDRDAMHRYEELASHFLGNVDVEDRRFVAERLATRPDVPLAVIRQLARDVFEVAAPVIRASPILGTTDLLFIIAATGNDHHRLIAERPMLPVEVVRALCLTGEADVLDALKRGDLAAAAAIGDAGTEARRDPSNSIATDRFDPWRFLGLDHTARRRVIADTANRPPASYVSDAVRVDRAFQAILSAAQIVGYARAGNLPEIISAIAEGLSLPEHLVGAAIHDDGGELLAVMLKALRLTDTQARQVFLLASPSGKSISRFFPLADLYAGMEATLAETFIAAWRDALQKAPAGHEPHLAEGRLARRQAIEPATQQTDAIHQARRA